MRRALITMASMLVIAAPMLVAQQTPAPPSTPRSRAQTRAYTVQTYSDNTSYLGIMPEDVTADRVAALKLKSERGVEVTEVDQDSPAAKAGIKEHDVILTFNGTSLEGVEELKRLIRETPPGRTVALGISRDGQPMTVNVQLAKRVQQQAFNIHIPPIPAIPRIEMPEMPSFTVMQSVGRNGIMVESLTAQLGDFFGVKNGEGVLVRSVEKGSPGETAGLKAGDVIVRVGNERVGDTSDFRRLISRHQGETVQLGVVREKREQTLSLKVPARRQTGALSPSDQEWNWDFDYQDLDRELRQLRPELEKIKAVEIAQLHAELQSRQKDIEQAQRQVRTELEQYMRSHRADMEKARREMERAQKELQRELQKELRNYEIF